MSGYKIIDLGGKALTADATGITVPGVYDAIEESFKAILIDGLVIGSTEYKPFYPEIVVSSDDFVFDIDGYHIAIDDDDVVTATTIA